MELYYIYIPLYADLKGFCLGIFKIICLMKSSRVNRQVSFALQLIVIEAYEDDGNDSDLDQIEGKINKAMCHVSHLGFWAHSTLDHSDLILTYDICYDPISN